jgi:hypothetical protein
MLPWYTLPTITVVDCRVRLEFAREQFLVAVAKTPVVACHLGHCRFRVTRRGQTMPRGIAVAECHLADRLFAVGRVDSRRAGDSRVWRR